MSNKKFVVNLAIDYLFKNNCTCLNEKIFLKNEILNRISTNYKYELSTMKNNFSKILKDIEKCGEIKFPREKVLEFIFNNLEYELYLYEKKDLVFNFMKDKTRQVGDKVSIFIFLLSLSKWRVYTNVV